MNFVYDILLQSPKYDKNGIGIWDGISSLSIEEAKKAIKSTALDSSFSIFIIGSVAAFGLNKHIDSISLRFFLRNTEKFSRHSQTKILAVDL